MILNWFILVTLLHVAPTSTANNVPMFIDPVDISVPHLTGIFVSLASSNSNWTVSQWVDDLTAMKTIGIEWFCVRSVVSGSSSPPISSQCPLGGFISYYNPDSASIVNPNCTRPANNGVDTISIILEAATTVGLKVHLGLGYPSTSAIPFGMNSTTYYKTLASMNWEIGQQLFTRYNNKYKGVITGWYTDVEESNSIGWLNEMSPFVGHYLEPLARDLHSLYPASNDTIVWASPYYVGNLTRHTRASIMGPRFYADWWGQMFAMAPHLDLVAPQDSMGAQGNSFDNVTSFLTEIASTSRDSGRKVFSNVEIFEVWPTGCDWSPTTGICKGRHPAQFERIKAQMANEAPHVDELIAWEWYSCLSPNANNETAALYSQYKAYIEANTITTDTDLKRETERQRQRQRDRKRDGEKYRETKPTTKDSNNDLD